MVTGLVITFPLFVRVTISGSLQTQYISKELPSETTFRRLKISNKA